MKKLIIGVVIIALGVGAYVLLAPGGKKGPKVGFRSAPLQRMELVRTVSATGTVNPRNTTDGIPVGSQVNGKLIKLYVDYNDVVTNGQLCAQIDPRTYQATLDKAIANLKVSEADVLVRQANLRSAQAELELAQKTYDRKKALSDKKMAAVADFDSAEEALARAKASVDEALANLKSAEASVTASQANVDEARADREYCDIRSPVNGIIIDREVEEGQTVVSTQNAVDILKIAEDLDVIWISADVPEADVGNIRVGQPVKFTADAYVEEFTGTVRQIRMASSETNNVVTYPVIIEAVNPDMKLFPGMTATLEIETARVSNALAVEASAFRFRPKDEDLDRMATPAPEGTKLWFAKPDGTLEAISVAQGISNDTYIEVKTLDGSSLEGRRAVIGYQTASLMGPEAEGGTNPFMAKPPARGTKGTAPAPRQ